MSEGNEFVVTDSDIRVTRKISEQRAKRELADLFCALADDTARKLNSETYDRHLLLEDLLTRIAELADAEGRDVSKGHLELMTAVRLRPAYEIGE